MSIVLSLGDFIFQEMEIPEQIPFHSMQRLVVRKMVGGVRQIDAMGVDPKPIAWAGSFFPTADGLSALDRALQVKAIMDAAQPVQCSWDRLSLMVYVSDFSPDYRFARIPYTITLEVLADLTQPLSTAGQPDADSVIGDDLFSANALVPDIGDATLTSLMDAVTSATFAASSVIASAQSAVGAAVSTATSLVGAPGSVVNSILQPITAAQAQVQILAGAQDAILISVGGPVAGQGAAANVVAFDSIASATSDQLALQQLGAYLGRMQVNLQQINSSARTINVSGGNLYDIAAKEYGDASAFTQIMLANGLSDPTITGNMTLVIPPYNRVAANGGILTS